MPDWHRIAQVSEVQNGDIAKLLIQTVLASALQYARDGSHVTLNMKIGRMTLLDGQIKFTPTTLMTMANKLGNR